MLTTVSNIPSEILSHILSFTDLKTISRASKVCKEWNKISNIEMLWKKMAESTYKLITLPSQLEKWQITLKLFYGMENGIYSKKSDHLLALNENRDFCSVDLLTKTPDGIINSVRISNFSIRIKNLKTNIQTKFNVSSVIFAHELRDTTVIAGDRWGKVVVINIAEKKCEDIIRLPEINYVNLIASDANEIAICTFNSNIIHIYDRITKQFKDPITTETSCIEGLYIEKDFIIFAGRPTYSNFTQVFRYDRQNKDTIPINENKRPFWTWSGQGNQMKVGYHNILIPKHEGSPVIFNYKENKIMPKLDYTFKKSSYNNVCLIFHNLLFVGTYHGELIAFNIQTGKKLYQLSTDHPIQHMVLQNGTLFLIPNSQVDKPIKYSVIDFSAFK